MTAPPDLAAGATTAPAAHGRRTLDEPGLLADDPTTTQEPTHA